MRTYHPRKSGLLLGMVLILAAVAGCAENPVDSFVSDERAIEEFRLPAQIGVAEITRTTDTAFVVVYVKPGTDLSAVTPEITVSYNATVSPAPGETVSFAANGGKYVYTVTSASGLTRDWLVRVEEFESDLTGTWKVTALVHDWYFGEGQPWGWGEVRPLKVDVPGAAAAVGDLLHFEIEGVDEEGRNFGPFRHAPGPGGEYADFGAWADKFALLPTGEATWYRDFTRNVLIFSTGAGESVETMELELSEDKQSLRIVFDTQQNINWDTLEEVTATRRFWYELVKVE